MSPSLPTRDRISPVHGGLALVFCLGAVSLLSVTDSPTPVLVALVVLSVGFMLTGVFDTVREHPLYDLASAAHAVVVFGLLFVASGYDPSFAAFGPLSAVFAVLSVLAFAVECYNYRNGTSYLRVDRGDADSR
ncbi:phosphatidate cytidylyltransferase [Halomarina oriensis]|uniref:Phosphatidate cytidylyltransferase n=1 Tax=Halomarina oriensis TaxID=671145 RepID=A0A6B0GQB3_9EURY|nr:phosphatidate cytidylyltransferase [Halomarina oriensis]MWG35557.1 phosphatidate cytidylyltransferase [Halomarina oriensis]